VEENPEQPGKETADVKVDVAITKTVGKNEAILSMIDSTLGMAEEGFSNLLEEGFSTNGKGRLYPSASQDSIGTSLFLLLLYSGNVLYIVPKAMDDFIVNNEKKKHSSYGMKSYIP
jgi:hypothetical protein